MANWSFRIFLSQLFNAGLAAWPGKTAIMPMLTINAMLAISLLTLSPTLFAQQSTEVINPDLDRRDVKYSRIDSENIEISPYIGLINIEDFDTGELYGARIAFHANERLFIEASIGFSQGDTTSYEELSGGSPLLTDSQRDYSFFNSSLGLNLFTGEAWLFDRSFSSNFYLVLGAGITEFADDDWTTINIGAGYRLFLTDWLALRLDVRDHIFNRDTFTEDDRTNNIELSTSLSFFF